MSHPCPVCFFKHMFTDCLFYVIQHCTATLHFVSASLHWFHRNHIHTIILIPCFHMAQRVSCLPITDFDLEFAGY